MNEYIYFVKGMHCASCEVLIERKLLEIKGIKSTEAALGKNKVVIEYEGEKPSVEKLNQMFKANGYTFSDQEFEKATQGPKVNAFKIIGLSLGIIVIFIILNRLGLGALVNVDARSSLPSFFVLGILAGLSTCAALVGGIILSMSKQWSELYSVGDSTGRKLQPHLMFNTGRLISYAVFGAILGAIGAQLKISLTFTSILVIVVSAIMFLLGLQMIGVRALQKFQISMPKFITRKVADEGKFFPFLLGAFTFLLPCGFTITAQGLALLSGSLIQGSLIMLFFALGTTFPLFAIGLSSVKLSSKPHLSAYFLKVAGIIVLFFGLFNINNQLNVLGAPSLSNLAFKSSSAESSQVDKDLAPIISGKQVIKMNAASTGYSPNYFKVKAGITVRWEITDTGTSGCTNAVISKSLFEGSIDLTPGQVSVKEFTVEKAGVYKFSCWMGMITGTIEVVDKSGSTGSTSLTNNKAASSGAETSCKMGAGCGCGGSR